MISTGGRYVTAVRDTALRGQTGRAHHLNGQAGRIPIGLQEVVVVLEPSVSAALVSRAQLGDVDAFEHLARANAPMMYRVALQVVDSPEDAQDVVQQALLSAWQGLGSFRGDAAFGTWLHQITRRHALNSVTRRNRSVALSGDAELDDAVDAAADPAEVASGRGRTSSVRSAVAALPARERVVVQMFHFGQLSYAQIATATDSTEPAVRSRLFRARRSLATALAEQC